LRETDARVENPCYNEQHVKRWLLKILPGGCLLLCLALSLLYIRAFYSRDELHMSVFRHDCLIATFPHHVHVILAHRAAASAYPTSLTRGLAQYPSRSKYIQPRLTDTGLYWEISIPLWLPISFAAALPAWVGARSWTQSRRKSAGRCPTCGYDLRATPERCPECGTVVRAT